MSAKVWLVGRTFGELFVMAESPKRDASGSVYYVCVCDGCGGVCTKSSRSLLHLGVVSCGCRSRTEQARVCGDNFRTHGKARTREHRIWCGMKNRCTNPSNPAFGHYGGRGIAVCDRWIASFEHFLADMGPCPDGGSIERIDVNAGYCPENCKWLPKRNQSKNRTNTVYVTVSGVTRTAADAARCFAIPYGCLVKRLAAGWNHEEAVFTPVRRRGNAKQEV